ncbi:Hg(II)-responsive transcriptional regulator [Azohydromonas sediminis]|uniref:Hg(II)-responsive transcriptional regulator n=1 Tax=Azohydromonas sediminis TaxID=2259674 RepID=UPI001F346BE3|nr:Hg(II)-responsive transcriptional regulator [Azohydromonas sediminis]
MTTTPRDAFMTIGELAQRAGVGVETVRYYQRRGLLAEPPRPAGGIRRYGAAALDRLRFVRAAQRLGFSLDEVAELLALEDGRQCAAARAQAERKLAEVRARLADLQRIGAALDDLVTRCRGTRGHVSCPLIAALRDR